jgi:hypothetical protein
MGRSIEYYAACILIVAHHSPFRASVALPCSEGISIIGSAGLRDSDVLMLLRIFIERD